MALLLQEAHGHCQYSPAVVDAMLTNFVDMFQQISAGGAKGAVYEHVRKNTNHNSPVTSTKPPIQH